ncbi:hypothetical protein J6590_051725 [Homalodisca vitripennis]|nr:hypothetical protein J6590_051725 [Homalodisca vitripennis]
MTEDRTKLLRKAGYKEVELFRFVDTLYRRGESLSDGNVFDRYPIDHPVVIQPTSNKSRSWFGFVKCKS